MWVQSTAGNAVPTPAQWSLPQTNWVMECWVLPVNDGRSGGGLADNGANSWFMSTATGHFGGVRRGACFQTIYEAATDKVWIYAYALTPDNAQTQVGQPIGSDKTRWIHVAVVNDNGVFTFYTNGVASGASTNIDIGGRIENCVPYIGSGQDTGAPFDGYLDECRYSTFAPGAFAVSDLLLRPAGPNILTQPQSTIVWDGGAAPFSVTAAFDTVSGYQWQRNNVNIPLATAADVVLPQLFVADSGTPVRCVLTGSSISVTSSVATATVVAPNPANVAAYKGLIMAESSLLAYFPVDGDIGATLTNTKDPTHNGTLEGSASYDGRTNRAFGQRALGFKLNGDVAIPRNPAFDFSGGDGTIEALVYLSQTTPAEATIFAEANDGGSSLYYAFRVSGGGSSLIYANDSGVNLSWATPASLVGKLTHVALVVDHGTNVTAYANGYSLGTKTQIGFGTPGTLPPAWIGSSGLNDPGSNFWAGTIDELAIYGAALSGDTIGIHASKFQSGTNEVPAVITGLPATGSKTLLTGGSASFTVQASGGAPLSYQWTTNGVAIPGATSRTLTLSPTTLANSGTYGVTVSNPYATTNSPTFDLTFVAPADFYATTVMNDHPSAYWRLDESSGTTAFDRAGGHDGTYLGSYTLGATSVLTRIATNTAVRFTAPNAAYGGRVEVPYSPALNPPSDQPFSIECFCYPVFDSVASVGVMVSSQNRGSVFQGYILSTGIGSENWDFTLSDGASTSSRIMHGGPTCYPNPYHVAAVWDGTSAYLYVNGVPSGTWTPTVFSANPSAPLEIGCRNNITYAFDGVIDEVAFYGYALSANQVSNHWSGMFAPAVITTQPVGVTTNEGSTVTLTAAATGYPITYQWYKGGVALDYSAVNSPDGTRHYPGNVNSPTLVISQTTPDDNGSYVLHVLNPLPGGGANTTPVNVTINLDLTPPTVLGVTALGTPNATGPSPYLVKVWFSKRIDAYQGTYAIASATVSSTIVPQEAGAAPVRGDWREAIVQTTGLTPGQTYTLNVSGVKDQTVTQNPLAATNVTFRAPLLSQGLAVWDYYYLAAVAAGVDTLRYSAWYPNAPMTNWASSTFDSTPITTGDLNNVVPFGSAGDNYGCSLSAWITPKVTGNYTFFLASDDASELWMNTNSVNTMDPQGAVLIANQTGCCNAFTEQTSSNSIPYTSVPITLQANTPYFIRAMQIEGGGGDYVKVAWRIAGDTNSAASLQPIPGTYLSSYAPAPAKFSTPVYTGGQLTISWNGTATLLQSDDLAKPVSQWTPVATSSPYQVTPATGGPRMYYRLTTQ